MFTGIVTDLGRVRRLSRGPGPDGGLELTIATGYDTAEIALGASIACSGVCLTVVAVEPGAFAVQASAETLARSVLGEWDEGSPVNLERALRVGDELGGHLVSGHVDGTGKIVSIEPEGDSCLYTFEVAPAQARYLIEKGSVALDGVSLTVFDIRGRRFKCALIPHTLKMTTLGFKGAGAAVNVESDMMVKYVERVVGDRFANGRKRNAAKARAQSPALIAEGGRS
jgi:riboflavin synthase